jgi:hypothetical protein
LATTSGNDPLSPGRQLGCDTCRISGQTDCRRWNRTNLLRLNRASHHLDANRQKQDGAECGNRTRVICLEGGRPKATRPTPLEWRALCLALRLPVSMRRIVACAGLWAGVFGWSESGILLSSTCLPPALRRRQGQSKLDRIDSGLKFPEQWMRPRRAIAACRDARIELFSDCSNHGGAIFTLAGFRSQALCQHST